MPKQRNLFSTALLCCSVLPGALLFPPALPAKTAPAESAETTTDRSQVLVTIDDTTVTRGELQTALSSSPFYTQFNTLDENTQASIRGDFLKRMVSSKLLAAEAKRLGLESSDAFRQELDEYTKGLLYRQYTQSLRQNITLSKQETDELRKTYKDRPDAFTAAKASAIARKYKALLRLTLLKLRDNMQVKIHADRITDNVTAKTVLMEGNNGLKLTYGDIVDTRRYPETPDPEAVREKLYQYIEYMLISTAARDEKLDISKPLSRYRQQRLPAMLVEQKAKEWISDEKILRDYFEKHPELGHTKGQWHIGQLVVKTEADAKKAEKLIREGKKSLFELAATMTIDPYGKAHKGDMGWITQGTGMPEIEQALKKLKSQELSPVIKTPKGFHLVTIIDQKPGQKLGFGAVKDKIRQRIISQNMAHYLQTLQARHRITWHVLESDPSKAESLAKRKKSLQ